MVSALGLRRSLLLGALSVMILLVGAAAAQAATFTVNTTADNAPNASECAGAAGDCGLRQAIDKANTTAGDDTVVLPAGQYTLTIPGRNETADKTGDLNILNNGTLTLTGAAARTTTIDAGGIDRVLQVASGATALISGVTITGGKFTSGSGGAGGIENDGVLHLDSSVITGNTTASWGGGLHNNSAGAGSLVVSNSTISANTSRFYGGGMDFDGGDGRIVNTTIVNNVSQNSSPGTTGGDAGGAMEIDNGNLTFQNDTIARNRVTDSSGTASTNPTDAGGVELYGDVSSTAPVFENTIIANNSPSDCHLTGGQGHLPEAGVNLDGDSTCFNGTSDKHANPLLGPLQNNGGPTDTMALLDGSPAINTADNSVCPATDQRGVTRPQPAGGSCDIGAYEATPPVAITNAASGVSTSGATLNGTVNPTNLATTYHLEYGTSTAYGTSTPSQSAGSDYASHAESVNVAGLAPNTTYHFRIVATNSVGTSVGADQIFTTSANAPAVITGPASGVSATAAMVSGSVNPNGVPTSYHVDYGTSTAYGKSTATTGAGSGKSPLAVQVRLTGLSPGAIYHYRLVAVSAAGTTSGGDRTFGTKASIAVAGIASGSCTRASSASVTVRVKSLLGPRVTVSVDGKRLAGGKHRTLKLQIALSKLRTGTHYLRVTVKSSAGTTTRKVTFHVCNAAPTVAPTFTG